MRYTIIDSLVDKLEEKLAKFRNKYKQISVAYHKSNSYICEDKKSTKYLKRVIDIDLDAKYQIKDYEFVAALEWQADISKNLVKTAPNTPDIPEVYLDKNTCEHCKTNRNRKYTILLKNTITGEFIQVGKSCVKEYIGIDLTDYVAYLSIWDSISEYIETVEAKYPKNSHESFIYVEEVLEQTCAEVRNRGYISKTTSELSEGSLQSTGSRIWQMFNHVTVYGDTALLVPYYEIQSADKELKEKVKKFIIESVDTSNYVTNLKSLLELNLTTMNNLGLIVSMVGYYLREENKRKAEEIAAMNNAKSNFIGDIGDKIEFEAIPELIYSVDTMYGTSYLYKFKIGNDIVTWKTTKYLNTDTSITIKGTIKEHNEYKNIKQTQLTRCKII